MDNLDFDLVLSTSDGDDYLIVALKVNEGSLTDFSYFATDLHELIASKEADGEFYIITCWCGDPGCAGIWQGIRVRHDSGMVQWHVLEPLPVRQYAFRREAYDETIRSIIKQGKRLLFQRRHAGERSPAIVPEQNAEFLTTQ